MTQFKAPGPRRVSGGELDVYTVLSLAGLVSVLILLVTLWIAGTELARERDGDNVMPWESISAG